LPSYRCCGFPYWRSESMSGLVSEFVDAVEGHEVLCSLDERIVVRVRWRRVVVLGDVELHVPFELEVLCVDRGQEGLQQVRLPWCEK